MYLRKPVRQDSERKGLASLGFPNICGKIKALVQGRPKPELFGTWHMLLTDSAGLSFGLTRGECSLFRLHGARDRPVRVQRG